VRRAILHHLSLALARDAGLVLFARALVGRVPAHDRIARIASVFTFVSHLVDVPAAGRARDGADALLVLAGAEDGPAVILAGLLKALGERAHLEYTREMVFVRVRLEPADLHRLPPHAALVLKRGRRGGYLLPLDPRRARIPLGFLPQPVRQALQRRLTA
jgi:hypothetical protein